MCSCSKGWEERFENISYFINQPGASLQDLRAMKINVPFKVIKLVNRFNGLKLKN